jgi:NAD(P)-dependent dehydrogenase (short-subunit alcohol dehydrogenase family)
MMLANSRILISGGSGYLGRQVVTRLAALSDGERPARIVSHDLHEPAVRLPHVDYVACDIRAPQLGEAIAQHHIDVVVHLAAIMPSGKAQTRDFEYDVDVNGTRRLLEACVQHGVKRIVVSSSGAAYGYHADNAPMADRGHAGARQCSLCLFAPQAPGGGDACGLPQQPSGAGTGCAAHWHHPRARRCAIRSPTCSKSSVCWPYVGSRQPLCLYLGSGRGGHHPARGIRWPARHLQRSRATAH